MSDRYDELGRTLGSLLREEAESMKIDTSSASERLARELPQRARQRRIGLAVAAAVVATGVVAALLLWSGGHQGRSTEPVKVPATVSPSGPTSAGPPFFLDPENLDRTTAPDQLAEVYVRSFFLWFSPDGNQIAYGTCRSSAGLCSADDKTYVADADGSGRQRVRFPGGANGYVKAWSADGTKLLYQVRYGGTTDVGNLFAYDLETRRITQLTHIHRSQGYWHIMAGFSADGGTVVYDLARRPGLFPSSTLDVWSVPVNGGPSTRLIRDAAHPAYLADGRIAFVRDQHVLAAEPGTQPSTLVRSEGFVVSPDGKRIAYDDNGRLRLLDVTTGESDDLVSADEWTWAGNDRLLVVPTA